MTLLAERSQQLPSRWRTVVRLILVFVLLYVFLGGMGMMGHGLKALGKNPDFDTSQPVSEVNQPYRDVVYDIFSYADNPLVGLFVGILATSIFQSSSFTTSFAVSLVVTTPLTLHQAIFIVMGANIGTSVTGVGVSFAHVRRPDEFARAYGAATVHDFFKTLTVLVFFPLEWIVWRMTGTGVLEWSGSTLAAVFSGGTLSGRNPTSPMREALKPVVNAAEWLLKDGLSLSNVPTNVILGVLGVVLLFVALIFLTLVLRNLVVQRVERFFDQVLFRNDAVAFVVGLVLTAVIQSSSVTTSLVVPLAGAGLLNVRQILPYTLGAAIGTTVTALLASMATSADTPAQAQVGLALAFSHMLFNVFGSAIWYPFRAVPIGVANWFGGVAARSKKQAVLRVVLFFFALPIFVIGLCWLLK
ncbi:MAG TPA: Na/Pi symporter [Phycisphaerae bacterium]|nr:Na/Pi symporter [Phycisphaerae bacterium]